MNEEIDILDAAYELMCAAHLIRLIYMTDKNAENLRFARGYVDDLLQEMKLQNSSNIIFARIDKEDSRKARKLLNRYLAKEIKGE